MKVKPGLLLGALLPCLSLVRAAEIDAQYLYASGVTFDLEPLRRYDSQPSYEITDGNIPCTEEIEKEYTYAFGVASDVTGDLPDACPRTAAVQLHTDDESVCVSAGRLDTVSWALLDEEDPTVGVSLTYGNGDPCSHNASGASVETPRTYTIQFWCADVAYPSPESAYETVHCAYTAAMHSYFGCPTQCPVAGRALCNAHGHCAMDTDSNTAACFCDEGWYGDACDSETDPDATSLDGTTVGMLGTLLAFSIVLTGVVFYLVRQIKAYRRDASMYMRLQGGGDMDGV